MGQELLAFVAAVKGGGSDRCRCVGVSYRDVDFWLRRETILGSLAPPTEAQESQRPTPGPSDFFRCGHGRQEGAYEGAHPAPRGRDGRPQCNVPPKSTGPRPA